jgi:hypothetical protein
MIVIVITIVTKTSKKNKKKSAQLKSNVFYFGCFCVKSEVMHWI